MAKAINYFLNSIMDSDTHYPFLNEKSFVRAENLRASGEGDDGSMKNIRGSIMVSDLSEDGKMKVVGMYAGANNKLYYFLAHSNGKSKIVEYDIVTKESRIIIEDTKVLRFDLVRWNKGKEIFPYQYILSITQLDDLLIFSNEKWRFPRMINLKRVAEYASGFTEEDISMAKMPPQLAPVILSRNYGIQGFDKEKANKFVSFSYRYKYKDGDYSALSFYSDTPFLTDSKEFEVGNKRENKSMVNRYQSLTLAINTGGKNVTDIEVYAREHGSNTAYLIDNINKKNKSVSNNTQFAVNYNYSNNYEVLNEEDTKLMYNNIPMFSKTQDSAGSRIIFGNYKEGFSLKNIDGEDVFVDFKVDKIQSKPSLDNRKTALSLFSYMVGVVYYNDLNMSTTVLLPQNQDDSDVNINFEDRLMVNKLQVKFPKRFKHPAFATKMKFVVKSEDLNFENLYITYARKIGLKTYLLLNGDNVNRVRKGDLITRVDAITTEKKEYQVQEVKEYGIDDGLVQKGLYALIETDDSFVLEDNGSNITKDREKYWSVIDSYYGTANPARFDATSGWSGVYDGNSYSSYENRGRILNSDFGQIKEGDSLKINVTFTYGRDKKGRGEDAISISGSVSLSETLYASMNYNTVGDFIKNNLTNPYIKVEIVGDEVRLLTNNLFPDLVKERAGWIYDWQSNSGNRDERAVVKVKTIASLSRGIKPIVFRTNNQELLSKFYYETPKTYLINNGAATPDASDVINDIFDIDFYNGYTWGNGVESYKIRDEFNAKKLQFNFRGSLVEPNGYKEIHRKNDVTYSGLYNYELGINRLSNFNPSIANWKTMPIKYGEIQRIICTDGDISVFATNKVMSLLYGKSLIMDLRGNSNLALSDEVLGDTDELDYDNGISLNPESIAKNGNVIFFTDKFRTRFLIKVGNQIQEINGQGSGFLKEGVKNLKKYHTFLGAIDNAHGEYVCSLDHDKSLVFNTANKGFALYYTSKLDYHIGMAGSFFVAYNGRIYENFVSERFNRIAGQTVKSKLILVVNNELDSDKVFQAIQINSDKPWDVKIKTNYTESSIPETQFEKIESFYYSDINKNESGFHASAGIGVVKSVSGNRIEFATEVPEDIFIGDLLQQEDNYIEYTITNIGENFIEVLEDHEVKAGEYVFANRQCFGNYRPDGEAIRGKWMELTLSKLTHEEINLSSISTEIVKSNL